MPQISKIRIVNFTYNDGKRVIADELYDFSNKDEDKACNTLINLANGGGKSVLVQLMMQPVLPKAKVAGRKIESFFTKACDHCFVLIEWLKDNSTEKLLTGIAMAASDSSNRNEDDNSRGIGIKYYTFYCNYTQYNSIYNIVSMPLSEKENGNFVAADFNCVRELSKKSNGILNYYPSDDSTSWRKKIAEYGLIQEEWKNVIEQLNSDEGGMSKFFEKFKTSDSIIDNLLIPTIEGKLGQAYSKSDDSSLCTMLINHATNYSKQKEQIKELESCKRFIEFLQAKHGESEKLWDYNDHFEQAIKELTSFSSILTKKHSELQTEIEAYSSQVDQIDKQIKNIHFEKASYDFYEAEEKLNKSNTALSIIEEKSNDTKAKDRAITSRINILDCARIYQRCKEIGTEIEAIRGKIKAEEQGSDASVRINDLRYSVYKQLSVLLPATNDELVILQNQKQKSKLELNTAQKNYVYSEGELRAAQSDYDKKSALYDAACNETDQLISSLEIEITRMLDGCYRRGELSEIEQIHLLRKDKLDDDIAKLTSEKEKIEKRRQDIPGEQRELYAAVESLKTKKSQITSEIETYLQAEEKIKRICDLFSLNFERRFDDTIQNYLTSEISRVSAESDCINRKISLVEEQIKAAKRGSVHVSDTVICYLQEMGIRFQTCEQYLQAQVENGTITKERCLEILEHYPAVAYGLLLNQTEIDKIFDCEHDSWLPSMIPLFTHEQMDIVLKIQDNKNVAIAFYSKEYFTDKEHFIDGLERQCSKYNEYKNTLKEKLVDLQEYHHTAKGFCYCEQWLQQHKNDLENCSKEITQTEKAISKLIDENQQLSNRTISIETEIRNQQKNISTEENWLNRYKDLLTRLDDEDIKSQKLNEASKQLSKVQESLRIAERIRIQAQEQFSHTESKLEKLIAHFELMKIALEEVKGVQIGDTVEGDWQGLLGEYHTLVKIQGDSLSKLREDLEKQQKCFRENEEDLFRYGLDEELYKQEVYSDEEYKDLNKKKKEIYDEIQILLKEGKQHAKEQGASESEFKTAQKSLSEFSELPLEKHSIGSRFNERIKQKESEKKELDSEKNAHIKTLNTIQRYNDAAKDTLSNYKTVESTHQFALAGNIKLQYEFLRNNLKDSKEIFEKAERDLERMLVQACNDTIHYTFDEIRAIGNLLKIVKNNNIKGDKYFTLGAQLGASILSTQQRISQIETDLEEFNHSKTDLIHQCMIQGRLVYKGLCSMARSSNVTVYEGKSKKQILKIDIPLEVDENVAESAIDEEITKGTNELAQLMLAPEVKEFVLLTSASKIVGSCCLLRKYVGKDSISVQVYKIDQNADNAGYRTWEKTQINNSGGEKLVIYFALILSLMSYTRSDYSDMSGKEFRGVLILDNPFGALSSPHLLKPMFEIAKHFKVQLICLSDISKADITSCFEILIKAVVKQRRFSNIEMLTHEGNEEIEHGFYRSEQLTF